MCGSENSTRSWIWWTDITVNGSNNDSDDGYGLLYDEVSGNLYVAGYLRETGEGANIWLAIYDTDLDLVREITMNGPVGYDTDKARFMTFDDTRHLFVSGSMTQAATDYDIWIGKFEDDLDFVDEVVVAGPTTDEDKGYGIVFDGADTIFVTGTMIETDESYNIWMAKYDTDLNLHRRPHDQRPRRRRGRRLSHDHGRASAASTTPGPTPNRRAVRISGSPGSTRI